MATSASMRTQEVDVCDVYRDSTVFKVSHIGANDIINKIYVFCGKKITVTIPDGSVVDMNTYMRETFMPAYFGRASGAASYRRQMQMGEVGEEAEMGMGGDNALSEMDIKIMSPFFSLAELATVVSQSIPIIFVNERIHLDDTITTIKRKIMRLLNNDTQDTQDSVISKDELYLFGKRGVSSYTTQMAYDELTRAGRDIITRTKMEIFISNIDNIDDVTELSSVTGCEPPQPKSPSAGAASASAASPASAASDGNKHMYYYDDVRDLSLECKMQVINVAMGHSFLEDGLPHMFSVIPFVETSYNPDILEIPVTDNGQLLLMDYGLLLFNTICVCTMQEVMVYSTDVPNKNDADGRRSLKIYFPFIAKKLEDDLSTSASVNSAEFKRRIAEEVRVDLSDTAFDRDCANVNLFYDVYDGRTTSVINPSGKAKTFSYAAQGIRSVRTVIKPGATMVFPIEAVFKTVCTTDELLFIKLNYAKRDNLYKLHAPGMNRFGGRVPFLETTEFNRINKLCKKSGRVSLYYSNFSGGAAKAGCESIICEFDTAGNIFITVSLRELCSVAAVDEIIKSVLNPTIKTLNYTFERNGFSIMKFSSLYDTQNVDVVNMTYELHVNNDNAINVKEIFGCGYSIFNLDPAHAAAAAAAAKTTTMIMKRVSNFNEHGHNDLFIRKQFEGMDMKELAAANDADDADRVDALIEMIANKVVQQFGTMDIVNAQSRVRDLFDNYMSSTVSGGASLHGMRVTISNRTPISKLFVIENINNVLYLCTFPIYIDAMLRIFHNESSTSVPEADIKRMCSVTAPRPPSRQGSMAAAAAAAAAVASVDVVAAVEAPILSPVRPLPLENAEVEAEAAPFFPDYDDEGMDEDDDEVSGDEEDPFAGGAGVARPAAAAAAKHKEKYPFLERLQKMDDILFFHTPEANENAYSRCCPKRSKFNNYSHPVALTDEEMIQFDDENPDFVTRGDEYPLNRQDMSKTSFLRYSEIVKRGGDEDPPGAAAGKKPKPKQKKKVPIGEPGGVSLDDVVVHAYRYGRTPDKMRWYICPRFWDLDKNKFISQTFAEANYKRDEAGKFVLLPPNVYEFASGIEPYRPLYPGFAAEKEHAGLHLRMPCCSGSSLNNIRLTATERENPDSIPKWKSELYKGFIIPPYMENAEDDAAGANTGKASDLTTIFEPTKMPITAHRLGYLPVPLQQFLFSKMSSQSCSANGEQCLLRRGVEKNKRQSFIGAIAYIYADYMTPPGSATVPVLSIKEMRRTILDAITLDAFISYHNGSMVTQFTGTGTGTGTGTDEYEIPAEYKTSIIYSQLIASSAGEASDAGKSEKMAHLRKICAAFDRFKTFFNDDSSTLDHSLMWDIVTMPNPKLFAKGNNMIVLDLPENDDTHNVRIVCPSNHYADRFYDHRKPTFFIVKKYNYYEPICLHIQTAPTKKTIMHLFHLRDPSHEPKLFRNIRRAIEVVKRAQNAYCANSKIAQLKNSSANSSSYKQNHHAKRIDHVLRKHNYAVTTQVLNYDNRVIGLIAEKYVDDAGDATGSRLWGYIPTEASDVLMEYSEIFTSSKQNETGGRMPRYDIAYTDDATIEWQPYSKTSLFLEHVHAETSLPCMPRVKVLDDTGTMVIGLITETNQFVRSLPEVNYPDKYDETATTSASAVGVKGDHFLLDKVVLLNRPFDPLRNKVVNEIRLESNFYSAFRVTARHALNHYLTAKSRKLRKDFEAELNSRKPYSEKMQAVIALLKTLLQNYVEFVDYMPDAMTEIYSCIASDACGDDSKNGSKREGNSRTYCVFNDRTNTCMLKIPKYKIISDAGVDGAAAVAQRRSSSSGRQENKPIYYARLADELVRYSRIRLYMFSSANYLLTGNVRYGRCEDELIVMQSDLETVFSNNKANRQGIVFDKVAAAAAANKPKPKANTSFFNVKRSDNGKLYSDETAAEILSRIERTNPAYEYDEARTQRITSRVISSYVGEQLRRPDKFRVDVFDGGDGNDGASNGHRLNGAVSTFAAIANILHLETRIAPNESVNKIKSVLCDRYADLKKFSVSGIMSPLNRICELFSQFGMRESARNILNGVYPDEETVIRSSRYTLTPFDIWLLAEFYKIPMILMSNHNSSAQPASSSAFHSKMFHAPRVLYSTPGLSAEHYYVIVCMQPINEFPIYGVLSYSSAPAPSSPTHSIPSTALQPLVKPDYSTPAEFLKSMSSSGAAAVPEPNQGVASKPPQLSETRVPPSAAAAAAAAATNTPAVAAAATNTPAVAAATVAAYDGLGPDISQHPISKKQSPIEHGIQLLRNSLSLLETASTSTDDVVGLRTVSNLRANLDELEEPKKMDQTPTSAP